ncbi:thiolase domain-containing protein [Archaeoglobus sp.]|uniref:thiolase domain-containing protein n=1 Tax=Archaeoglobus sp. TaxID=1872626 RepID=UPI00338FD606
MLRNVAIVGAGITNFGRREASWKDLVVEAGKALFDDVPNLDKKDVDSFFIGAAQPERWTYQTHVAPLAAELLGIKPRRVVARTESACASGQIAIRYAWLAVASGLSDVAVVVGVEKMNTKFMNLSQTSMMNVGNREFDTAMGLTAPPYFAMVAQRHMHLYGTTEEQMALVREKAGEYASANPYAQFQKKISKEDVLNSRMVAPPLKLLDCSGITDGAAALLITTEEKAREFTDTPVWILGGIQRTMANSINEMGEMSDWLSLRYLAKDVYDLFNITPDDIDVAEVHDCFTISEIMEYEELGFCKKGEGGKFIEEGQSYIGGKVAVNPSGGLLANGHPLGATGVRQAWEMVMQFRGEVPDKRYVSGAELGLAHNLSGMAQFHHIMLYSVNRPREVKFGR